MSKLTRDEAMKGLHRALQLARAANQPEAGTETIDEILDRAFVSPRIVDQSVVEDWSNRMRDALQSAANQQKGLSSAAAEFKELETGVRATLRQLQQKMELAAKLIPTLDQRIERTESGINQASERMDSALKQFEAAKDEKLEIDRTELRRLVEEAARTSVGGMMEECRVTLERMVRETMVGFASQAERVLASIQQTHAQAVDSLHARARVLEDALQSRIQTHQSLIEACGALQLSRVASLGEECLNQTYLTAAMGQNDLIRIGGERISELTALANVASDVLTDLTECATTSMTSAILTGGHELRTGVQQIVDIAVLGSHAVEEAVTEAAGLLKATEQNGLARLNDAAVRIGRSMSESAREDAQMLSQTAVDAVAELTNTKDKAMKSLTGSANALMELATETRERVRLATETGVEKGVVQIRHEVDSTREALQAQIARAQMIIEACAQAASRAREEIESVSATATASMQSSSGAARTVLESVEGAGRSLSERLNAEVKELESRIERGVAEASTRINKSSRAAATATKELRREIEKASVDATDRLTTEVRTLDERLAGCTLRVEELLRLGRQFDLPAIEHAASAAESATAKALNSASHLNSSLGRAERLQEMVDRAIADLEQLRGETESARRDLAESVRAGAEHMDRICEQIEKIRRNSAA